MGHYYYVAVVRQLIIPPTDFEVIYLQDDGTWWHEDVMYFGVCDLIAAPRLGASKEEVRDKSLFGVVLPVVFNSESGLEAELVSYYRRLDEQRVELIRKGEPDPEPVTR